MAAAIRTGDFPTALAHALAAWREARGAELAELVDAIDRRCRDVPIPGRDARAYQAAWLRLAEGTPSPVAIGALAETVGRNVPVAKTRTYVDRDIRRHAAFLDRVAALADLSDDPRIASALVDILEKAPYTIESGRRIYQPAIDLIVRIADARSVARLRALVATPRTRAALVRAYFAQALPAAADAIARVAPEQPSVADRAAIREALAALTPASQPPRGDVEQLTAECLAHPGDDGPREVLADVLQEREDPRGEFLTLQLREARGALSETERTRSNALLRAHEKTWLGELAIVTKHRVWRRGFLDEAELARNAVADRATWERAAAHPALASVRRLAKGAANAVHYQRFVESPATPSLTTVTALGVAMIDKLKTLGKPIEHVLVETPFGFSADIQRKLGELADRVPSVKQVTFSMRATIDEVVAAIAAWPARTRFQQLVFAPPAQRWREASEHGTAWLQAHARLGVPRLGLRFDDAFVITERAAGKLVIEHEGAATEVAQLIAQLPRGRGRATRGRRS